MNVIMRGIKNALRSPLRSGAIILMLAISIGLILCMLVARGSINNKIAEVKATAGTNITIRPAGVMGFAGGGDLLTATQISTIKNTAHISSVTSTLSDQLSTSDTDLTSSLEMGNFGERMQRFESSSSSSGSSSSSSSDTTDTRPAPTPRITVTGTTDPDSVSSTGGSITISSGKTIDGNSSDLVALVGTDLAEKNSLKVGSTFTAYSKTVTVVGIFETGNTFQDSGIIMPLAAVQTLTDQTDEISSVVAKVDSSDNVSSVVSSLKSSLGSKADIISEIDIANNSVSSLEGIASLALAGVVGATVAGAVIILLAMVMIVRERKREIGVIKAIGGTNITVITQFMTEALTLTVVGAVIGLSLGILVSGPMTTSLVNNASSTSTATSSSSSSRPGGPGGMMMRGMDQISKNFTQVTASLTPQIFLIATSMTLLIAVVGSAVPAWFIARIRPAEVLRSE